MNLASFPKCPSCGYHISWALNSRKDAIVEYCTMKRCRYSPRPGLMETFKYDMQDPPKTFETFEPIRPLSAPEGGAVYAYRYIFGEWAVFYGEGHWPSRSYWAVPGTLVI